MLLVLICDVAHFLISHGSASSVLLLLLLDEALPVKEKLFLQAARSTLSFSCFLVSCVPLIFEAMGGTQSSVATSSPPIASPPPVTEPEILKPPTTTTMPAFDIDDIQRYLQYRIPSSIVFGGLSGGAWGYYIGDAAALYSCTYAFGFGFASTAFFCGTYGLRTLRQQDDIYNYAISGSLNSAWMVTGLAGRRKGMLAGLIGGIGGIALKVSGDWLHDTARMAWITHRKVTLDNSRPRLLGTMTQRKTMPGSPNPNISSPNTPNTPSSPNTLHQKNNNNDNQMMKPDHPIAMRTTFYLFGTPKPKLDPPAAAAGTSTSK